MSTRSPSSSLAGRVSLVAAALALATLAPHAAEPGQGAGLGRLRGGN